MATHQTAVVFFNGPSVTQFYHTEFPQSWITIGCNYISRHRAVDHVCAFDQQVVQSVIVESGTQYWTRANFSRGVWQHAQTEHRAYDSGTLALTIAGHLGCHRIFLLGFDWCITNQSQYDGDYTWRKGYPEKTSPPKWDSLRRTASARDLKIVHYDHTRPVAGAVWITPDEFLKQCHDEHCCDTANVRSTNTDI